MNPQVERFNDFIIRPPRLDDIPAIVALLNADSRDILGTKENSVDDYTRMWTSPGYDPALDSRIAITADGTIAAMGHSFSQAPYVRNFLWVSVHPNYRGCGLGTYLTEWGEARARERIAQTPVDTRVTISSSAPNFYRPAADLLGKLGYQHNRSFYNMKIAMSAPPPQPVWTDGITICHMQPGQEEAVYRAQHEAFRDHWGFVEGPYAEGLTRWLHFVTNHPSYDPSVFFLAMAGNEIAGVALCFPKDNEFPDMAWVDDLAVRRPWRRQGVALALLHHAFGEFYRRGIKQVGLGVDASSLTGATRLYEKAGMHIFRQFDSYEKELRAGKDLMTQSVEG